MKLERIDLDLIPLLQGADLDIIFGILKDCPIKDFSKGKAFIKKGEPSNHMYLILDGALDIHVEKLEYPPIMSLKKGDSVGEIGMLDEKPRSAFVVSRGASTLLEINKDIFWSLVNSSHEIAVNLLLILSARLRGNNDRITESLELQQKYRTSAIVDILTNLNNRKWINETIPKFLDRAKRDKNPISVCMIDIDHFKNINDSYGHQAGDFVLSNVAMAYKNSIRPTDFAARYGGEEFTLIFPGQTAEEGKHPAERVRKAVMNLELTTPNGVKLPQITISIGIAQFNGSETMNELLERSDKALYEAKENGRNQVQLAKN
jgi:diguanylate cyclase (GGDEF)-like protein